MAILTRSIFIFCYLAVAGGFSIAEEPNPKIGIITKEIDVGEVAKGKIFDYKIEVENKGTADLVIENVYSSCGCLEVTDPRWRIDPNISPPIKPQPVIVKPNESIFIETRLDTNKVSGQFEKQLHVISNDSERKDLVWNIKGVVLDSAAAQPGSSNIGAAGQVQASYAQAKTVMLFYSSGCWECKEIKEKFLPELQAKYKERVLIVEHNIDNAEAFSLFLDLQNKYDERAKVGFFNPGPPAVFVENKLLYGTREIEEKLEPLLQ